MGNIGIEITDRPIVSGMGLGIMRFKADTDGRIPQAARSVIKKAYESGINYFDSGFEYIKGTSESIIKSELVDRYPRETFFIADKLPIWKVTKKEDVKNLFEIQLERLGVGYIDFYLIHAVNNRYFEMIKQYEVMDVLSELKDNGYIKKLGFSFHDNEEVLEKVLDHYSWDFCQLQINYYDWYAQHAKSNYELCTRRNIPVFVMEPIGGGRLINLPEEAKQLLRNNGFSPAGFALSFFKRLENVRVVLSGSLKEAELEENIKTLCGKKIKDDKDDLYAEIVRMIQDKSPVPCSACGYCLKECPRKVDIPLCFQKYNDSVMLGIPSQYRNFGEFYFNCIPVESRAENCIKCGKCAKRCPQSISIPNQLSEVYKKAAISLLGIKEESLGILKEKKVVCFGSGNMGREYKNILERLGISITYFCDNSKAKWGTVESGIEVISPDFLERNKDEYYVLISSTHYDAINEQLEKSGINVIN